MRNSQIVSIVLILLFSFWLINWVTGGESVPLAHLLPFLGGDPVSIYDIGAIAMLVIAIIGVRRSARSSRDWSDNQHFLLDEMEDEYAPGSREILDDWWEDGE